VRLHVRKDQLLVTPSTISGAEATSTSAGSLAAGALATTALATATAAATLRRLLYMAVALVQFHSRLIMIVVVGIDWHRLGNELLDLPEQGDFVGRTKADGMTTLSGARGAADAVDVSVGFHR